MNIAPALACARSSIMRRLDSWGSPKGSNPKRSGKTFRRTCNEQASEQYPMRATHYQQRKASFFPCTREGCQTPQNITHTLAHVRAQASISLQFPFQICPVVILNSSLGVRQRVVRIGHALKRVVAAPELQYKGRHKSRRQSYTKPRCASFQTDLEDTPAEYSSRA